VGESQARQRPLVDATDAQLFLPKCHLRRQMHSRCLPARLSFTLHREPATPCFCIVPPHPSVRQPRLQQPPIGSRDDLDLRSLFTRPRETGPSRLRLSEHEDFFFFDDAVAFSIGTARP